MPTEEFLTKATNVLNQIGELTGPISALPPGQWRRGLSQDADASTELGEIGRLRLAGEIAADVFVTDSLQPPFALDDSLHDDGATASYASARLAAQADANFETSVAGTGWKAGASAEAGGRVVLATHQRVAQSAEAFGAVVDVLERAVQNPFTESFVRSMAPDEAFQFELDGRAAIQAHAGMEYGVFREFRPGSELGIDEAVGVQAGIKAGVTVLSGIDGSLRIRVLRTSETKRRVQLFKRTGTSVGAGLGVTASVQFTQVEPFVHSLMERFFEIPDGLADRVLSLQRRLSAIRGQLDGLEMEAKAAVEQALGQALEATGLARLRALVESVDSQPDAVRIALTPVLDEARTLFAEIDESISDLTRFLSDAFEELAEPLTQVESQLETWLAAYSDLKKQLGDSIISRAQEGVEVEIKAALSRSRSRQALLDLEFDISHARALDDCVEAMLGDFTDALTSARSPGAHGVELLSGALKETIQRDRSFSLKANLFGFELARDLQSWTEVAMTNNLVTGSIEVTGSAGSLLVQQLGQEKDDLAFAFDFFGGALDEAGRAHLGPDAGYRADLFRGGTTVDPDEIAFEVNSHLSFAATFGPLPEPNLAEIRRTLDEANGQYEYQIHISFSPAAIRRAFLLEQPSLDAGGAVAFIRARVRHASRLLGYHLRDTADTLMPLSSFLEPSLDELDASPTLPLQDFHVIVPNGPPITAGSVARLYVVSKNVRAFSAAYVQLRTHLISGGSAASVAKALRRMAQRTRSTTGSLGEPFDAKFVALALAAGHEHVGTLLRMRRGDVEIEL